MSGNPLRLSDGLQARSRFLGQHPGYFRIAGQAGITPANAISPSRPGHGFRASAADVQRCRRRQGRVISLAFQERQQVGIDRRRLRGGHAVREVLVGLHGSVL
jgi:hypothetical protein